MDETTEQKEVKMPEEKVTEPEQLATPEPGEAPKATVEAKQPEATPEPTTEIPGAEVTPEAEAETKTVEELAEQVKACVIGGEECKGLGKKLSDMAEELDLPVNEVIDNVLGLTRKD